MNISPNDIRTFRCHKQALNEKTECPYTNSPFEIYKNLSSKKKGKYFELIVKEYLCNKGYKISKAFTPDHDCVVDGSLKLEVKGSLLWGTGTHFKWQQIRTNQDYDVICFLAVYPDGIKLFAATKEVAIKELVFQDEQGFWPYNQHGGKKKNSGTFAFDVKPNEIPSWFQPLENLLPTKTTNTFTKE
jgi:hypothetical protein